MKSIVVLAAYKIILIPYISSHAGLYPNAVGVFIEVMVLIIAVVLMALR